MNTSAHVQPIASDPHWAVFPDPWRTDDDPLFQTYRGRAVYGGTGREILQPDPAWNARLLAIGGRDLYGRANFRAVWGYGEQLNEGCTLRYPQAPFQWLVLRRFPASAWGTRRAWYAPRIDEGVPAPSFAEEFGSEYPATGAEEIWLAFPKGTPFCLPYAEDRLLRFVHRDKLPSAAQRMKDHRAELEAEELELWQRDYDHLTEKTRAFGASPFVGYGKKSGQRKRKQPPSQVMTPQLHEQFKVVHAGRMARWKRQQVEGV